MHCPYHPDHEMTDSGRRWWGQVTMHCTICVGAIRNKVVEVIAMNHRLPKSKKQIELPAVAVMPERWP